MDRYRLNQRMGRKAGTVYLNPKKFGALHKPCMKDMLAFLNCLALNHNSDDKCERQKELLGTCMDAQVDFHCSVSGFCIFIVSFPYVILNT